MKSGRGNLWRVLAAFFAAAFFASATSVAHAAPVGMACHIKGRPDWKSGNTWRPLRTLQKLESGDAVRCSAGEEAIIVLFGNGKRYRVKAGATAIAGAATLRGATALADASGPSMRVAQALGGARVGAVMARPATSHQRLTPQFSGYIVPDEGDQARLEWTPIAGAREYSLSLSDWFDDVVWSGRVAAENNFATITFPALQLRRAYVWHLAAIGRSGKPVAAVCWGTVTFLSEEDAAALSTAAAPLELQQKQNRKTQRIRLCWQNCTARME